MRTGIKCNKKNYMAAILFLFILSPLLFVRAQSNTAYFPSLTGSIAFPNYNLNTGFIGGTAGSVSAYVDQNSVRR